MPDSDSSLQPSPTFNDQLAHALGNSLYLRRTLENNPHWQQGLENTTLYAPGQLYQSVNTRIDGMADESELMRAVRQTRHQETVRIAWRDLNHLAPLEETMRDISDLADALVSSTLNWWHRQLSLKFGTPFDRTGTPQHMLVLGLGKLGGRELNFSSDIDLIFTFPEAGATDGRRQLDNLTYFTRLGQKLINTLGQTTADGFAYRVDMRLRPFGEVGALALSFDAMEHYYQTHGREWERYALIKARVIAGDQQVGKELLQRLRPFIYRRYLDYGAVEQLRDLKNMINREALRKGKQQDVKLGTGGIREIEFTAQVFQLMRGGRLKDLQQTNLLQTLDVLEQQQLLSTKDIQRLRTAYVFLRQTENRLQMWDDEQTHSLPEDKARYHQLAGAMQYQDWDTFLAQLNQHRDAVSIIFQRIFAVDSDEKPIHKDLDQVWQGINDPEQSLLILDGLGFQPAHDALSQLDGFRSGRRYQSLTELARARVDRLIPLLINACVSEDNSTLALERSLQVIQAIASRSGYIAMLCDQPMATEQLVKLVHASSWITTQLTQHPILLDNLLDSRQLHRPLNREELQATLQQEMNNVAADDTELVMERLRQFKLTQTLRVATADITGILPLMIVSDQLSWIAETILEFTTRHAWYLLTQKAGIPCYEVDGQTLEADFGIVAYGKLGGLELGYSSDLDIIFIHNSTGNKQRTNGNKQMDNTVFFARLAQKTIHILSTYTHDGRLYEIDTRLRPSGQSGLLVIGVDALRQYQLEKAWVWEHQALLRARIVTGSKTLQHAFEDLRRDILCQPRDKKELLVDVTEMRKKMWESLSRHSSDTFNLKKDQGGITDIEFIVQFLILAHAHQHPELTKWSDNIRQLESLEQNGLLNQAQAEQLANTYRTLRNHVHALALQEQKAFVPADQFSQEQACTRSHWATLMA